MGSMSKATTIRVLRVSYWAGAIFDALVIIPMLSPGVASMAFGIPNFNPGIDERYAMGIAASLMLGWTSLLIWAARKPIQRRGVLLLTIFPVLVGLIMSGVYAVTSGFILTSAMLPTWVMQGIFVLLYAFGYLNANRCAE
jgi:hypothetical protein